MTVARSGYFLIGLVMIAVLAATSYREHIATTDTWFAFTRSLATIS